MYPSRRRCAHWYVRPVRFIHVKSLFAQTMELSSSTNRQRSDTPPPDASQTNSPGGRERFVSIVSPNAPMLPSRIRSQSTDSNANPLPTPAKEKQTQRLRYRLLLASLLVFGVLGALEAGHLLSLEPTDGLPPTDWVPGIEGSDLLFSFDDRAPRHTLRATIGNGYLGVPIDGNEMFVAGVFNGPAVAQNEVVHRAKVSAPLNLRAHGAGLTGSMGALDVRTARYMRRYRLVNDENEAVEQRWLAHRGAEFKGVLLMELQAHRRPRLAPCPLPAARYPLPAARRPPPPACCVLRAACCSQLTPPAAHRHSPARRSASS